MIEKHMMMMFSTGRIAAVFLKFLSQSCETGFYETPSLIGNHFLIISNSLLGRLQRQPTTFLWWYLFKFPSVAYILTVNVSYLSDSFSNLPFLGFTWRQKKAGRRHTFNLGHQSAIGFYWWRRNLIGVPAINHFVFDVIRNPFLTTWLLFALNRRIDQIRTEKPLSGLQR